MKVSIPTMTLFFMLSLFTTCLHTKAAHADETDKNYGTAIVTKVISVYNGDTFQANIQGHSDITGNNLSIRINNIDTPEINSDNQSIKAMANQAKLFTQNELKSAKLIELRTIRRDKHSQIVADVYIDGGRLAEKLINAGIAQPYFGGEKPSWSIEELSSECETYVLDEQYEKALNPCSQSLRLGDRSIDTYILLGMAYYNLGKYEETIKIYNECDCYEYDINLLKLRASSYSKLGKHIQAIQDMRKVVLAEPYDPLNFKFLGEMYAQSGDIQNAQKQVKILEGLNSKAAGVLKEYISSLNPNMDNSKTN